MSNVQTFANIIEEYCETHNIANPQDYLTSLTQADRTSPSAKTYPQLTLFNPIRLSRSEKINVRGILHDAGWQYKTTTAGRLRGIMIPVHRRLSQICITEFDQSKSITDFIAEMDDIVTTTELTIEQLFQMKNLIPSLAGTQLTQLKEGQADTAFTDNIQTYKTLDDKFMIGLFDYLLDISCPEHFHIGLERHLTIGVTATEHGLLLRYMLHLATPQPKTRVKIAKWMIQAASAAKINPKEFLDPIIQTGRLEDVMFLRKHVRPAGRDFVEAWLENELKSNPEDMTAVVNLAEELTNNEHLKGKTITDITSYLSSNEEIDQKEKDKLQSLIHEVTKGDPALTVALNYLMVNKDCKVSGIEDNRTLAKLNKSLSDTSEAQNVPVRTISIEMAPVNTSGKREGSPSPGDD